MQYFKQNIIAMLLATVIFHPFPLLLIFTHLYGTGKCLKKIIKKKYSWIFGKLNQIFFLLRTLNRCGVHLLRTPKLSAIYIFFVFNSISLILAYGLPAFQESWDCIQAFPLLITDHHQAMFASNYKEILPENLVTISYSKHCMKLNYLMNKHFNSDFVVFYNTLL